MGKGFTEQDLQQDRFLNKAMKVGEEKIFSKYQKQAGSCSHQRTPWSTRRLWIQDWNGPTVVAAAAAMAAVKRCDEKRTEALPRSIFNCG
jgi:hypothetical protein